MNDLTNHPYRRTTAALSALRPSPSFSVPHLIVEVDPHLQPDPGDDGRVEEEVEHGDVALEPARGALRGAQPARLRQGRQVGRQAVAERGERVLDNGTRLLVHEIGVLCSKKVPIWSLWSWDRAGGLQK